MPINDQNQSSDIFWLNIGAEEIYNSTQIRKDAVQKLQATIAWVFSVYTATTIGSTVFGKSDWNVWALLVLGFGFMGLTLAYWLATVAGFPVPQSFYANEVASIQTAFNDAIKRSNSRFKSAVILTSIGVFLYSTGLLIQFGSPAFNPVVRQTTPCVSLNAVSTVSARDLVIVLKISSRKNSWNKVTLLSDTVINKKVVTDTITDDCCLNLKTTFIYADSTATGTIKFKKPSKRHLYVMISREDTLSRGTLVQTVKLKYPIY